MGCRKKFPLRDYQHSPRHHKPKPHNPWLLLFFSDRLSSFEFVSITTNASLPELSRRVTGRGAASPPAYRRTKPTRKQNLAALATTPLCGKLSSRQVSRGGRMTLITGSGRTKKRRFWRTSSLSLCSPRTFSTPKGRFRISFLQISQVDFICCLLYYVSHTAGTWTERDWIWRTRKRLLRSFLCTIHSLKIRLDVALNPLW